MSFLLTTTTSCFCFFYPYLHNNSSDTTAAAVTATREKRNSISSKSTSSKGRSTSSSGRSTSSSGRSTSSSGSSLLLSLPEEILIYIINYFIDPESFLLFASTCTQFYFLCLKHQWTRTKRFYTLLYHIKALSESDYETFIHPIQSISDDHIHLSQFTNIAIRETSTESVRTLYIHQFLFFLFLRERRHHQNQNHQYQQKTTISTRTMTTTESLFNFFEQLLTNYRIEYNEWYTQFQNQFIVSFEQFYQKIILTRSSPILQAKAESFRQFISTNSYQFDQSVSLYRWLVLLDQFGPSIEHLILHFYSFPFVGHISYDDTTRFLLTNHSEDSNSNCYIIRNSETFPEQLTISYIILQKEKGKKNVQVRHRRKPCGMSFDLFIHRHFASLRPIPLTKSYYRKGQ
jgi:hypothetical protein